LEIGLALVIGLLVGLVVGLLGAGGSILTVPALMLLLGLTATQATGTSLVVVVVVSGAGLAVHGRAGRVNWRSGAAFAVTGVPAAAVAGRLSVLLSDLVLTIVLVVLLGGTSVWMWRRRPREPRTEPAPWTRVVPSGLAVGAVTGLLGVGGGFMVVPALAGLLGMPIPIAIGTSQLVLVVNALAGLGGRLGSGVVDLPVGLLFAVAGAVGSLVASRLVGRLSDVTLTRIFAALLLAVSVTLLVDAVV
jgi:uncharacterized protein